MERGKIGRPPFIIKQPVLEGLGDVSRLKVERLMQDTHYALLMQQLEKYEGQEKSVSLYQLGVLRQVMQLLETAKVLAPTVRAGYMEKAYEWYVSATGSRQKPLEEGPKQPSEVVPVPVPSLQSPREQSHQSTVQLNSQPNIEKPAQENRPKALIPKEIQSRPQSGIIRSASGPAVTRPLTAAAARKLIRPDSSKLTLASTKITTGLKREEEGTEMLGCSRHLDVCEELSDYSLHYRTIHPEITAPRDALLQRAKQHEKSSFGLVADFLNDKTQPTALKKKKVELNRFESEQIEDDLEPTILDAEDSEEEDECEIEQEDNIPEVCDEHPKYKKYEKYQPRDNQKPLGATHLTDKDHLLVGDFRENQQLSRLIGEWRKGKSRQLKQTNRRTESAKLPRPKSAKQPNARPVARCQTAQPHNQFLPFRRPLTRSKNLNRVKSTDTIGQHLTSCVGQNTQPTFDPLDPKHLEKQNQQNLDQIDELRRLLGKTSNISMKCLTKALIYTREQHLSPSQPRPEYPRSYLLMHNPFVKKKKLKRKKRQVVAARR